MIEIFNYLQKTLYMTINAISIIYECYLNFYKYVMCDSILIVIIYVYHSTYVGSSFLFEDFFLKNSFHLFI
jgi:hypothetical protein